jgi:hypothetical protein
MSLMSISKGKDVQLNSLVRASFELKRLINKMFTSNS